MDLSYIFFPAFYIALMISGVYFTNYGSQWFGMLTLPKITPPSWYFGLVWAILYMLISSSALLWWRSEQSWYQTIFIGALFLLNGFFNGIYSYLFFYRHYIGWATLATCALEITTLALITMLWHINPTAALLLVPYVTWCAFAILLNICIWWKN